VTPPPLRPEQALAVAARLTAAVLVDEVTAAGTLPPAAALFVQLLDSGRLREP
jgi:hypothetical protein